VNDPGDTGKLSETVRVAAPPERVWRLYDDLAALKEWAPNIRRIEILGGGAKRVGCRFRVTMDMAGWPISLEEELVAYEPPVASRVRGSYPGMKYEIGFRILPEGEGARCFYECVPTYSGLMRPLAPLGDWMNRSMLRSALRALKGAAEAAR
jgi:hypothetical protein